MAIRKKAASLLLALVLVLVATLLPTTAWASLSTNYQITGNGADDIVSVAKAQLGKTKKDFGWTQPWCAYFTCWAGRTAGANFPRSNLGTPRDVARWFVNNNEGTFYYFRDANYSNLVSTGTVSNKNLCVKSSQNSFTPQKGDLIIYLWSADAKGGYNWSHIGIVESCSGGKINTVEGNTNGGVVGTHSYSYGSNSEIVGFVRPSYSGSPAGGSGDGDNNGGGGSVSGSLSLSSSSVTLQEGASTSVTVSLRASQKFNLGGSIEGNGDVSCSWRYGSQCKSSGGDAYTNVLDLTGVRAGTVTMTLRLTDVRSGKTLDTKTLTVNVTAKPSAQPAIVFSPSQVVVEEGKTASVTASITPGGAAYGSYGTTNGAVATANGTMKDNNLDMTVTGKAAGTTELVVKLLDDSKNSVYSKSIPVTVTAAAKPNITSDKTGVLLKAGERGSIVITFQPNGAKSAGFQVSDTSICSASWTGTGNTRTITILGLKAGVTDISVELKDGSGKALATLPLSVCVEEPEPEQKPELKYSPGVLNLDLDSKPSDTVYIDWEGPIPAGSKIKVSTVDSSGGIVASLRWGSKGSTSRELIVTGVTEGQCMLSLAIVDANGKVISNAGTVTVNVASATREPASIEADPTNLTLNRGETGAVKILYTGDYAKRTIRLSENRSILVSSEGVDKPGAGETLGITAVQPGSATCVVTMLDEQGRELCAAIFSVEVKDSTNLEDSIVQAFSARSAGHGATDLEDFIDSSSADVGSMGVGSMTVPGFSATGTTSFPGTTGGDTTKPTTSPAGSPTESIFEPVISGGSSSSTIGTTSADPGVGSGGSAASNSTQYFTDVDEGEYYADSIFWAVDMGVTDGIQGAKIDPNGFCPRGQVVEFLWRAQGCPAPKAEKNPFTDVSESDSCYDAVLWAYETGVTTGTSETAFSPKATCTRAQVMTFLWRVMGQPAASSSNSFTDVVSGEYYVGPVNWAVEKAITTGTSETTFSPADTCTRAQILTFLFRCLTGDVESKV